MNEKNSCSNPVGGISEASLQTSLLLHLGGGGMVCVAAGGKEGGRVVSTPAVSIRNPQCPSHGPHDLLCTLFHFVLKARMEILRCR